MCCSLVRLVQHAILHLLYSRFVYKAATVMGLIPAPIGGAGGLGEPFKLLLTQVRVRATLGGARVVKSWATYGGLGGNRAWCKD